MANLMKSCNLMLMTFLEDFEIKDTVFIWCLSVSVLIMSGWHGHDQRQKDFTTQREREKG